MATETQSDEPITPEEVSQIIRDQATALAVLNDGHVNCFELKRNVLRVLGERFDKKTEPELEEEIQFTAARAMSIHLFGSFDR